VKPQDLSLHDLTYWVRQIVQIEQPIHADEVGRRLATGCGWQRAGNQIQDAARRGLQAARRTGDLVCEGEFWCVPGAEISARDRSGLAASDTLRKPAMIAPLEIEAAGLHALQENLSMTEEELVVESARLLGFARIGSDVRALVEGALQSRLFPRLQRDRLGRLKPPA
jgi:hypothetical protein